ncbi:hypothetical protein MESMUL_01280 [Mesosutterella multiformis]|uniref:DUF927 domain-containing protein n=1 Tax=Mesosutterella multiformis TaxID=2259133 RepID=A0A388SDG1_9BURK|nr:DUF927 domain-containing protein [Mesosutterella multiformis]GBO92774.1 hypothetical protein MESMUL_01280 [Mesosutterella multiformis]
MGEKKLEIKEPEGAVPKYARGACYEFPSRCDGRDKFKVEKDGIYRVRSCSQNGGEGESKTIVCARLDVVGKSCGRDGKGWGRVVEFKDDNGKTHRMPISMAEVGAGGSKLTQRLLSEGLPFCVPSSSGGMAPVNQFLMSYPLDELPTIRTVDCGGWADENFSCFVLGDGLTVKARRAADAELGAAAAAPAVTAKGTFEEWKRLNSEIAPHSKRLSFAICVALAASVLPIIGDSSRIFHFFGKTSTGKSTGLKAASTVWGGASWVNTWNLSANAASALAKKYNNLPLILDELGQAKDAVRGVSYTIGNGVDRSRSDREGNAKESKAWSLYALSSGEGSLEEIKRTAGRGADSGTATGELVRFINIPAQADPEDPSKGIFETFPKGLATEGRRNWIDSHCGNCPVYGTAGVAFLQTLIDDIQNSGVVAFKENLRAGVAAFEKGYPEASSSATMGRVLHAFAIVAVAGELAISYGVLPWNEGDAVDAARVCFEAWASSAETPEAQEAAFIESLKEDPKKSAKSYQIYWPDGKICDLVASYSPAFGRLIVQGTPESLEGVMVIYDSQQFDDVIARAGRGLPKSNAISAIEKRGLFYSTDKHHQIYSIRRKSAAFSFGLTAETKYRVIALIDNLERIDEIMDGAGLPLRAKARKENDND